MPPRLRRTRKRHAAGQNEHDRYSLDEVAEALRKTDGLVTYAAKRLKCTYQTVIHYIARYPELEEVREQAREGLIDLSESKLVSKIKAGNLDAVKYHLDRIGKKRGYVVRSELAGVSDQPINIKIVPAKPKKEDEE